MDARRARALILLLAGLSMLGPFAIDTFFPAFPAMAAEFGASPFAMQQTLSVYLIAYACMSLFHGGLSDALGRRPVILVALAGFGLASIGAALAPSLNSLLVFRALQGLTAGAGVIVGRAIVRDCFEGARAQRVMSAISMLFGIAPAVAPIVGGLLLALGWRSSFWFLAALTLVLWIGCWRGLPETHPPSARMPLRWQDWLASYRMLGRDRRFVLLSFAAGANFAALFTYISAAPAFVFDIMGMNERQFGYFFVPVIGGMVLGAFVSGKLAGHAQPEVLLRRAYVLMLSAGLINLAYAALAPEVRWPWAVLPLMGISLGVALAFPILSIRILDLYPERRGSASSLQMFLSLLINASVAGVVAPLVQAKASGLALTALSMTILGWILQSLAERVRPRV